MHSGPQGETETCVQRTDWTSNHLHGHCLETARTSFRNAGSGLMDPTSPGRPHTVVEHVQRSDGPVDPRKLQGDPVISTQHAERLRAVRRNDESAPSMSDVHKLIVEKMIKKASEPPASLATLSRKEAAVAATRPRRTPRQHRRQRQSHRSQTYDFEQQRDARSRVRHRIQGRERVDSVEALMTALTQQPAPAVIGANSVLFQSHSGGDMHFWCGMEFSQSDTWH